MRVSYRFRWRHAAALALGALLGTCAHAHNFCVATSGDLQAALDAAADGGAYNGEDNMIAVETGNFSVANNVGGQRFAFTSTAAHYLDIQGGWSNNCTAFANDPTQSVLDGNHSNAVMQLRSAHGSISVRNLTIQNGMWPNNILAAGLTINLGSADLGVVSVTNLIIRNNVSASTPAGITGGTGGIYFANNLLVGNSSGGSAAAGELFATGYTYVTNNTIVNNASSDVNATGGLRISGDAAANASNNILWNNTHVGLELTGNAVLLIDNDIGADGGSSGGLGGSGTPAPTSAGNLSLSPQFVGGGDHHLGHGSPLIAIGTPTPPGGIAFDLEGHPRPLKCPIDLGAYEETIFLDSFEAD